MKLKYEITDIQHLVNPKLFRIRALRDIIQFNVNAGDLGGYIEHEVNLSQDGDCWIGDDACVYGNARVSDNAQVYENARVLDNAQIFGYARVFGDAGILSDAWVSGNAKVFEHAWVSGNILLDKNITLSGECHINSNNQIYYVDGVTAYFDNCGNLTVIGGISADITYHETLARLKLL